MSMFRKLATLATAAEAARRYAKKNPDKASKYLDQAAQFLDKQTKGKYSGQISGVASKAKNVAGIKPTPGYGAAGNGYTPGTTDLGSASDYGQPKPSPGPVQH
jgi:alkylation response protein AidB-like acyl-CoA dehydrogenase